MNKVEKIPANYKQTELGVIPEDWDVKRLNEVANVVGGGTPSTQVSNYWNGLINWFTPTEIGLRKYTYNSLRKITKEGLENCSARILPKGTVLLTTRAGIGDVSILMSEGCTNQGFQSLIANDDVNHEFLYYLISALKKVLIQNASGSTFLEISPNRIKQIKVRFPKLKEQTAIATVLSATDALIEHLEKLIAKKKAIKQGAMQQLLTGRKRLPGFSGKWDVKTLGEIGKFKGGSGFPIKYQGKVESKYPFYKVSDMNNDGNQTFMRNSNNWIDESTKKIIGSNIFPEHTIVFAKIGEAIYLERKKILFMESCIDNNMMGFIFDEFQSDYRFLHYLFLSIQLGKLVSATALPSLNGKQIAELSFPFPRKKEQTAIATVLSDMDTEIESLEQKRDKYTMLKQGMMQQLLTGRIRIYANN